MKKVTITLDEDVVRWARVQAIERNTSLSRLVGELLRQHMRDERTYHVAMKRHLSRKPKPLKRRGARFPARDEVYERRPRRF